MSLFGKLGRTKATGLVRPVLSAKSWYMYCPYQKKKSFPRSILLEGEKKTNPNYSVNLKSVQTVLTAMAHKYKYVEIDSIKALRSQNSEFEM